MLISLRMALPMVGLHMVLRLRESVRLLTSHRWSLEKVQHPRRKIQTLDRGLSQHEAEEDHDNFPWRPSSTALHAVLS
jgi:hypothetical protein